MKDPLCNRTFPSQSVISSVIYQWVKHTPKNALPQPSQHGKNDARILWNSSQTALKNNLNFIPVSCVISVQ